MNAFQRRQISRASPARNIFQEEARQRARAKLERKEARKSERQSSAVTSSRAEVGTPSSAKATPQNKIAGLQNQIDMLRIARKGARSKDEARNFGAEITRLERIKGAEKRQFAQNANKLNVPQSLQNVHRNRAVADLTKLRRKVTSSNLDFIDFRFEHGKKDMQRPDIENVIGTLIVGFKRKKRAGASTYEFYNCPFKEYINLFNYGKAGFWHHAGEDHSFAHKSAGHYFYYFIKNKYAYKKIR